MKVFEINMLLEWRKQHARGMNKKDIWKVWTDETTFLEALRDKKESKP